MTLHSRLRGLSDSRGGSLVEFAFVTVMLVTVILGVVEMCRMVLVYTTVANAARAGARYAMVHGSDSTVSPQVKTFITSYLQAGTVNPANATVTTSYPDSGCTSAGCHVSVSIVYPYNALTGYFPLHVNLGSTSEAVITY